MTISVFYEPAQAEHDPSFFLVRGRRAASPERPSRGEALLAAAVAAGLEHRLPAPATAAELLRVHTPDYLAFLETGWDEWQAIGGGDEVIANAHPARQNASYPRHVVGRAGWHMADAACPLGRRTYRAATLAAGAALAAARRVIAGGDAAYALARPPGHHASTDMAGGFCFLNNTALAAAEVVAAGRRPAILDIDVHHGNGTQAIFYDRRDVLHVSLHADPSAFYPWFWGHVHERGAGPGEGWNVNLPLPLGTDDAAFLTALQAGLAVIRRTAPDVLVVALGLDVHEADPLAAFAVTTEGFRRIGEAIGAARWPTVLVQEGGYPSPHLDANLARFLDGFRGAR